MVHFAPFWYILAILVHLALVQRLAKNPPNGEIPPNGVKSHPEGGCVYTPVSVCGLAGLPKQVWIYTSLGWLGVGGVGSTLPTDGTTLCLVHGPKVAKMSQNG